MNSKNTYYFCSWATLIIFIAYLEQQGFSRSALEYFLSKNYVRLLILNFIHLLNSLLLDFIFKIFDLKNSKKEGSIHQYFTTELVTIFLIGGEKD